MYEDVKYSNTLLSVFNNNLIIQWGKGIGNTTFPIAFKNYCSVANQNARNDCMVYGEHTLTTVHFIWRHIANYSTDINGEANYIALGI